VRDEFYWVKEARRKQIVRELGLLQSVHLAAHGGREFAEKQERLLNDLGWLEGKDRQRERWDENWRYLKTKKRG